MILLIYLYWSLVLLNIIAFLIGRNVKWLSAISSLFLILFVMGKRPSGDVAIGRDYGNYELMYNYIQSYSLVDMGYKYINIVGHWFSLSFENFYMVVVALIILILILSVIRIGGNLHLFIVSYLIYFDMITIDLIRNQCAIALFTLFVFTTYYKNRRFWPGWLLASTFHVSFYLYLVPLYLSKKKSIKLAKQFLFFVLSLCTILFLTGTVDVIKPFITLLLSVSDSASQRYSEYLGVNARFSFLLPFFVYFVLLMALIYWKKLNERLTNDPRILFYCNYIYKFSLFCSIFLVLTFLNLHLYRYIRDLTLLGIMFMGINTTREYMNIGKRSAILAFTLIICFSWFYFDVIVKGYFFDYASTFYINEILNFN